MNQKNLGSEEKKCGNQSCGCSDSEIMSQDKIPETKKSAVEIKKIEEEIKLDPTHFGDWQVNCRAIDF